MPSNDRFPRRLGAHQPLGRGMVKAAERAGAIGATAIQVFSDNPTTWRRRANLPEELPAFRDKLASLDIAPIAIHAAYLSNLAGPDETFIERSVELVSHELTTAAAYGARYLNIHAGSHHESGLDVGIRRLVEGLGRVFASSDVPLPNEGGPRLLLENSAGGGYGVALTIEELERILDAAAARGIAVERLGFCLDTAHLWGAGAPIDDPDGVDAMVAEVRTRIGTDQVPLIHLNDSKAERGSRMDRHEHVGAGRIGIRGMHAILTHPDLAAVTYVVETPGMDEGYDAINVARARAIAAGEPIEPLPPEAFELRGSRARTAPAEPRIAVAPLAQAGLPRQAARRRPATRRVRSRSTPSTRRAGSAGSSGARTSRTSKPS
jgi:deoxyribonuclease-4